MVKTSNNVTVTDAKMKALFKKHFVPLIKDTVQPMIIKEVDNARLRSGVVTKFYPYLDKAEVRLDQSKKKVLCRLSHRYIGAVIDFYTPAGTETYCNKLHEPCIIPRDPLHCFIVRLHEEDDDDYLLVDYYYPKDIVGFAPPKQGNMKISVFRVSNEDYIQFGGRGLVVRSKNPVESYHGEYEDDVNKSEYANSKDVYTKEEVDKLLDDLRNELKGEEP